MSVGGTIKLRLFFVVSTNLVKLLSVRVFFFNRGFTYIYCISFGPFHPSVTGLYNSQSYNEIRFYLYSRTSLKNKQHFDAV